jgi:hypothetical protein
MAIIGTLPLNSGPIWSAVIDSHGEYAYLGTGPDGSPAIAKVRLDDLQEVGYKSVASMGVELPQGTGYLYAAVIDEAAGFAYFGTDTEPGLVLKVRLADLSLVDWLFFNPGEGPIRTAVIDTVNGLAYFGLNGVPKVVKVSLTDFREVASITLHGLVRGVQSSVIDPEGGFAYFSDGTNIERVRLLNFVEEASSTEGGGLAAAIDPNAGFAYFAGGAKIRLSDFALVAQQQASGAGLATSMVIDPVTGFAYEGYPGTYDGMGLIQQISLNDMSVVSTANSPVNDFWSAVIDPAGQVAYFDSNTASAVLKINIASTQVATWSTTLSTPSSFSATLGTETIGTNQIPQAALEGGSISPIGFAVVSSAVAFSFLIVGVLAIARIRRSRRQPAPFMASWVSVVDLMGGGMLLVASLWQLEIVDMSRKAGDCAYIWPFALGGPTCWWIARDFWYSGVFAAFVLALIGAVNYARYTKSPSANQANGYVNPTRQAGALSACDEKLYRYITSHGGTISIAYPYYSVSFDAKLFYSILNRTKSYRIVQSNANHAVVRHLPHGGFYGPKVHWAKVMVYAPNPVRMVLEDGTAWNSCSKVP